jgi:hypothetical protein
MASSADENQSEEAKKVRARKMIREPRSLGYRVELLSDPSSMPA